MSLIWFEGGPRHGNIELLDADIARAGMVFVVDEATGLPVARYVATEESRTIDGIPHAVWRFHRPLAGQEDSDARRRRQLQALA
jgi:hypothetical protein